MFRIGEKVVCVKAKPGIAKNGDVYIVRRNIGTMYCNVTHFDSGVRIPDQLANSRFKSLKSLRPPVASEVEWLDRVRDNFRE